MKQRWMAGMAAGLLLAGCGEQVEDRAERRGDEIAANVTDHMDRLADRIGEQVDNAADRVVDDHADRIENRVRAETDRAADEAGAALERVGNSLRSEDARGR